MKPETKNKLSLWGIKGGTMPRFIFLAYVSVIENVAKCLKMSFPRKRESINLIKSIRNHPLNKWRRDISGLPGQAGQ